MTSPTAVRDLEGKVALVTGATSGIGQAAAQLALHLTGHAPRSVKDWVHEHVSLFDAPAA